MMCTGPPPHYRPKSLRLTIIDATGLRRTSALTGLKEPRLKLEMRNTTVESSPFKGEVGHITLFRTTFDVPYEDEMHGELTIVDYKNRFVGKAKIHLSYALVHSDPLTRTFRGETAILSSDDQETGRLSFCAVFSEKEFGADGQGNASASEPVDDVERLSSDNEMATGMKGMIVCVTEAENLRSNEKVFVTCEVGSMSLRSGVVVSSGEGAVDFGVSFHLPFAMQRFVTLKIVHKRTLLSDELIGYAKIDLQTLPKQSFGISRFPVVTPNGKQEGSIAATVTLTPGVESAKVLQINNSQDTSGGVGSDLDDDGQTVESTAKSVIVHVKSIENCKRPDLGHGNNLSPYVCCQIGHLWLRTRTVNQGTGSCEIGSILRFPYENHRSMKVELWDNLKWQRDPQIGKTAVIDLLPITKAPLIPHDINVDLIDEKSNTRCGAILLQVAPYEEPISEACCVDLPLPPKETAPQDESIFNPATDNTFHPSDSLELEFGSLELPAKGPVFPGEDENSGNSSKRLPHPYIRVFVANRSYRTPARTLENRSCKIQAKIIAPYDPAEETVKLEIFDAEPLAADKLIGFIFFNVGNLVQFGASCKLPVELVDGSAVGPGASLELLSVRSKGGLPDGPSLVDLSGAEEMEKLDVPFEGLKVRVMSVGGSSVGRASRDVCLRVTKRSDVEWTKKVSSESRTEVPVHQTITFPYHGERFVNFDLIAKSVNFDGKFELLSSGAADLLDLVSQSGGCAPLVLKVPLYGPDNAVSDFTVVSLKFTEDKLQSGVVDDETVGGAGEGSSESHANSNTGDLSSVRAIYLHVKEIPNAPKLSHKIYVDLKRTDGQWKTTPMPSTAAKFDQGFNMTMSPNLTFLRVGVYEKRMLHADNLVAEAIFNLTDSIVERRDKFSINLAGVEAANHMKVDVGMEIFYH